MEPERWRNIDRLYHQALEHAEGERAAFLKRASAGDEALHQAVASLLAAHARAEEFLEIPAVELAAHALAETAPVGKGEADILGRLRSGLADRYLVEGELGHGGMARVYLAEDRKHQRQVAIKVLRPDVAVAIGAERFLREIAITARLSHPHILPLHDSGEAAGFLYYVMPYVPGDSLRVRLERDRQLPLDDALQIAREIADALAHAHSLGIVHRDIKPENILFAGGHAVVADFGIARALSVAGKDTFTGTGIVIGTPAYMSPEQAAGSEQLDARSDVYSLGCVLYEMLGGRPPFTGASAQAVIAAQVTATPTPLVDLRRDTPPVVADGIDRALAKDPGARFQTAVELRDAIAPLAAVAAGQRSRPLRVAGLYGLAAVVVFGIAYGLTMQLGLPNWTMSGAALLLVAGFPIMMATGLVERRRAVARARGVGAHAASGLPAWVTWRRALAGGAVAFGVLGVGTTAYMAMRLLGIGPLGTLVAAGVLKNREPLILADFENRSPDSTLGPSLTTAFRVDLSESPVVRLLDPVAITEALRRAERPITGPVDVPLARDLAQRENVKAVVRGEIDPVGTGYLLSASVIAATDGHVLTAVRETADNDAGLIRALDRLSRQLRARIGESLKSIRAAPPLERVTTGSLEALRRYSEAVRARAAGDFEPAFAAFRDAVAIDTGFAMGYFKLAEALDDGGSPADSTLAAVAKAFALRERLPDVERYLVSALYYAYHVKDRTKQIVAYSAVLDRDPDNAVALDNLADQFIVLRQYPKAESLALRGMALGTRNSTWDAMTAQVGQGHFAEAETTLARFARVAPHERTLGLRALLASARIDYAMAEQAARAYRDAGRASPELRSFGDFDLAAAEAAEGKLSRAEQDLEDLMSLNESRGHLWWYFLGLVDIAQIDLRLRNHPAEGLKRIDGALRRHPLATVSPADRPYVGLSRYFARAGRLNEAARLLAEYDRDVPEGLRGANGERLGAEGDLLLARGRIADAIGRYQAWYDDPGWCCFRAAQAGLFEIATAYEQAHRPDSALAYYERVVTTPSFDRVYGDQLVLGPILKRLGELYEARGDRAKALDYYGRFVDLWKDADPELRPIVADARAALRRLSAEPR